MVDANEHVRFNKWLKIFEQSFQNASSKEELVAFIKASIEKESQAFPHFLAQYAEALEDQTSSSYSLQEHLSRINYPKLSILYNNIKEELQSIKAEGELLYGVKTEFAENEYEQNFEGLFEELNHSAKDPLIGFCKLADLCFRLDRAKNIDIKRLDRFEQKERTRKLRNEVSLKTAEERTPYLLGNDESGLISKSSLAMSEEVHQLKSAVEEAQREEEEALRIYEAAKRKTRLAESSLNEVETSIDMLQTQVSLLKQVNEVKLQLSKYNSESAELRLQLLSNLRQTISKAQDELDNGHLSQELPDLLNYLLHTLQNMFNISSNENEDSSNDFSSEDNNSKQLAFFHSIRVCYEALKLFKKLTINTSYHKFAPMVQGLETSLKQLLSKNLSTPTLMLQSKSTNIPKYKNATVVLYFTHLFHDTPSDHVEDQKRVETCLRVLMRLKLPSASNDTVRALTFEKCDHIKSPPFWCLSLVHSSHYLKRLYEYEKEAKRDDLYVPLEFDTEWESQYELSSDSEPEEIKRKAQNLFNFQPSKHWKQRLGDESMDHLLQILAPRDGDFTIANALTRKGKRIRSLRVRRRQSDVVVPEAVDQHKSETRASTPYGEGTVLELNQQTGFAKIRLVWGATAYLNSDSFKLIGQAVDQKIKKLATTPATPSSSSQQLIRFSHTDLRLHKLLTRILTHVRIQRHILEKVDVKDAHMSLWLHGRTSAGLSKNIEQASYRWLFNFRYQDLDAYIKRHDELAPVDFETNNNYECPTFMKDLLTIKLPSPLPTSTTPDEYFGSLEFNQEELKKDAFEYSARRLTNKSGLPRAKGSRNRRKKEEILAAQKESTETRRRSTGSKKRKFYDREMKPLDSDEEDDGERQEDGGNKEEREEMTEQVAERTEMTEELNEDNDNEKEQIGGDDQMTLASDNEIDVSVAKGENQPKQENTQQSADLALDFQPYELGAYHASTDKDRRFLPRKDGFWRLPALPDTRRGKIRKEINAGYFTDATDLQKFEELLQKLLVILMKRMNLKQITVAHELEKCFRSKHTQTGVSGWFHNRSSFELSTKLVMQSFLFIFTHQKYLQEKELSKFNDLLKHPYFQFILKGTKFVKLSEMTEEDEDELGLKRSSKSHQKDYDNDNNNSGQIQSNIIQVKVEDSTISSASPVATPQSSKLPVQHRLLEEFLVPPNLISPRSSIQIKIESTMDRTKSSEESVTHTEDAKTTIPPEESVKSSINPVVESEEMKDTEDIKSVKSDGSSIVEEAKANNKAGYEEMSVDSMEETENLPPVPESVVREIKIKNQEADLSEIEEVPQPRFKGRGRPGRKKKNIEYRMLPENERNNIENQDNNDDEPESPRDHTLKAKYSDKFYMQEFDEEKPISLKTIAMILNDFIDEVDRRELSHSYVAKEASRLSLSLLSQPIISKFIRLRSNPYLSRGDEFSYQVIKWLLYSQKKGANYANEERANCSHCGIYRNAFVTKTDFLTHLGICSTLQDRIKPMSKWKAFLEEESLKIDECLEKMLSGEMVISVSNHDTTSKTLVIKEETAMEIGETVEVKMDKDTSAEEKEIQTTSIPDLVSASIDAIPSLVQCNHCSRLVSSKNSIKCRTCPSLIHARCGVSDDNNNLYCQDCTLLGLSDGVESSTTVSPGQWVYVYTNANTAWRKAVVLYLDPSRPHIVLVKFIPAIDDADSYLWIDITKRNIYDISTAPIEEDDEDEEDDDEEEPGPKRKRRRRLSSDVLAKRESDKILKNRDRNEDDDDDLESEEEVPVRKRRGRKPRATTAENDSSATTTNQAPTNSAVSDGMTDTYVSANSLKAALCAAGTVCKGIDIVMSGENTNAFACTRPPGHHCGRNGCTKGSISTGFCLLNNAAIALTYARVFWGVTKIAIVDIDVHFGNGTAEIVQNDPDTFFASVQMIYGPKNDGNYFPLAAKNCGCGFYPSFQGVTEVKENYVSVGIFPANMVYALECAPSKSTPTAANIGEKKAFHAKESDDIMSEEEKNDANTDDKSEIMSVDDENIPTDNSKAIIEEIEPEENHTAQGETLPFCSGSEGYITAIRDIVIPRLKQFQPELLIISAGFDGYFTDPLGSELKLSTKDFHRCTKLLMESMEQIAISQGKTSAKVLSILEGGYDTAPDTLGLAKCVEAHVKALMGV